MRSKTSCFNFTIARNQLRRFWPLPLLLLAGVVLLLILPLSGMVQESHMFTLEAERRVHIQNNIYGSADVIMAALALAAFPAAALVFLHLHSRRAIQFYHALPVKRRCLYLTSYLTGLGMVVVPMLLGLGLAVAVTASADASWAAVPLVQLFGAGMAALLLFYAMASLACCIAGQTFGAVLIYGGMHCAVWIILRGAGELAARFMPGISFYNFLAGLRLWLTPLEHLSSAVAGAYTTTAENVDLITGFSEPSVPVIYGAAGVILAVLTGVVYQIRRAEAAGEMTAFPLVRTVCKLLGALVVTAGGTYIALSSGLFQQEIPFAAVVLFTLGFAAVGWIAAEMVVQKTLRVFTRKTGLSCGILLAVLLVLMGAGKLDLLGTVRYVPDTSEVRTATVCWGSGNEVTVDPEDAIALHQTVVDNLDALTNNPGKQPYWNLDITYQIGDGYVKRSYYILYQYDETTLQCSGPIAVAAQTMLETPEYCLQTWVEDADGVTLENFWSGTLSTYSQEGSSYAITSNEPETHCWDLEGWEATALYAAFLRDVEAGNVPPSGFPIHDNLGWLDIWYYPQAADGSLRYDQMRVISMDLLPEMAHTIACLRELGFTVNPE